MGYSVVPISMWVLTLMPSWSLCLSLVSGAVSGQVSDASVEPWLVQIGSEVVLKNQFYLGFSWPVSVPSGPVTGWVLSLLGCDDVDAILWLCPRFSVWFLPC